jgi:hypothetical protein
MPIYSVEAPNGKIYDVEAPEGTSEKSIFAFANQAYLSDASKEEPLPEYTPTPETGFIPSIKRGALGIQSLVGDVAPAMAGRVGEKLGIQGAGEYADRQMQEAVEAQQRIQQMYPAAVPSYTDIQSGGDLLNYVIESVGELIPSMIPSILTGGAAGIAGRGAMVAAEQAAKKASMEAAQKTMLTYSGSKLSQDQLVNLARQEAVKAGRDAASKVALKYQAAGAVGGSAVQNIPEVYQNVAQETGQEDLGAALLFGGFNSVLDAVTPLTLLRKAGGAGLTKNELIGAWYKRAGKGVLTGFATEGATEAVQEMSSAAAEKFVDENKEFFTPQNFERFINAGLKGGIGGGAISGATNVAFGQREAAKPSAITETTPAKTVTETTEPTKAKISKEEALAKVAATGKKKEEIPSDNRPDATASGVSAAVPGGLKPNVPTTTVAGLDADSVVDVGGAPDEAQDGEGEQRTSLIPESKPSETAVVAAQTKQAEEQAAEESAIADAPFVQWLSDNGYGDKDLSAEEIVLLRQQFANQSKEVITPEVIAAEPEAAAPVVEEAVVEAPVVEAPVVEAPKEVKPPKAKKEPTPAPAYNPSKTTQDLIAAEKARKAASKKPVEVMNQKVETGLDVDPEARRTTTHTAGVQLAQTYRQQQTELAKEIDSDETLSKEEKAAGKAFQNYMIVGNNNIKNALNILAADLFDGAGYNSNPYLPNVGGKSAQLFYGSLNPANKKFVDDKVAFLKAQEKRLSKYGSEAIEKTKKDFDEYGESITVKMTGKERKDLNKANKEKIAENEAKIKAYNESLKQLGETVKAEGEMFGGTTPAFMAHVLRGDLRSALNEIVKNNSGEFTALDKEVAKRLLSAKNLPSVVVVDRLPDDALGAYNTGEDTMYIAQNALNSHIVLHEAVHGYTTTMIRAWDKGEIVNKGIADLNDLYNYLKTNNPELATEYGIKEDLAEFASEVMSNRSFQEKLRQIPYKRTNAFTEFARTVLRILGIGEGDKFNALASALISVDTMLGTGRQFQETTEFVPETVKYDAKAQKETLKPELRGVDSAEDWIASIPGQPEPRVKKIRDAFTSVQGVKELQRLLQNERAPIKNWEDLLAMANKITYSGNDSTAIYTEISLSTGRAEDEFLVKMYNPSNAMYKAIGEYSKSRGIDEDAALKELQAVFIALHEGERRHAKYLMTVPLNAEAAMQRDTIMDLVRSADIDENTASALRTNLEELVANNKQEKGFGQNSEPSSFSLDEDSDFYNVAGIRPAVREETLAKYYVSNKEIVDQIRATVQEVHKATTELNKKANYWSQPVSNIVAFYGFENYVPLKGRPDKKESVVDDMLNFDGKYNGRELQEKEQAFEGRVSESNNPLLQTLSDGVRAALRAGRGGTYTNQDGTTEQYGITLAVKNAIDKKLLGGKKIATIQFKDRYKVGEDNTLPTGENTFFHYNPDGSIDIYSIDNTKLREAIRRTYRTSQPLIDAANNITSLMGQFHTRYNVAFAPMNFIRDTLTNAFTMGAEMGPSTVGAVASKVAQGGLARAIKVANLYRKGEFGAIEKLGEKDPYIKAMYEYIQLGGKVSYVSGIGAESQFQQMQKNLGRKKIAATKDSIDGVIDIWTNSFEFASRTAAYQVVKARYMNGTEQLSEREAAVKAAGYVKNLANFEQVGVWGKGLGAIFMFFRPSATGAVRAIEALVPLFRNIDAAIAGLPESVRNDQEAVTAFRNNMLKQRASAQAMLMSLAGAGAAIYLMALMLAEEDDEGRNKVATDDLARWTRYARFHIPGTDVIFQMPWGFGLGAFASAGAQIMSFGLGNGSIKDVFNNVKDVGFDAFLPLPISRINMWENPAAWAMDSATPSFFRPFFEYAMNLDGLGREIYNNRQTRSGDAYTGGDSIPELYKDAAKMLANITNGAVDFSPNTMYFFANNYADGLTRLIHNSYNIGMVGTGQKEFNPKTDTLAFDMFFGAKSNFDAREFSKVENQIKDKERKLNMFKNDPERYMDYVAANPFDQGIVDMYNKGVNGDLKRVRELANKYRAMPGLSPKERKELLDNVKEQQNLIKRHLISVFGAYEDLN